MEVDGSIGVVGSGKVNMGFNFDDLEYGGGIVQVG